MPVTWVVQTNVERESASPRLVREACTAPGVPFVGVGVERGVASLPMPADVSAPVVCHGCATLMRCALSDARLCHGVFFEPERFTHEAWSALLQRQPLP